MNDNAETQLQQLEITMEQAQESIALADALDRLHKNKDFKKVFLDGYMKEEASRAVLLRADPALTTDRQRQEVDDIITGIGNFRLYLSKIYKVAMMAERSIEDSKRTRQELLVDQLNEDNDGVV